MKKIKNWFENFNNNKFWKAVLKVGSGQLISQILTLVSFPILSRIYSNTAYGDAALVNSTVLILVYLSTFGLDYAVMAPEDDEESKTVFTTAFLANFVVCTVIILTYGFFINKVHLFEISDSYGTALILTWLCSIIIADNTLLKVYLNRKQRYDKLFFNPIIGAVANFVVAIPLGLLGFGYKGFMLTYIAQYTIANIHMLRHEFPFKRDYRLRDFRRVFKDYKEYIFFQYPSSLLNNFGIEYPTQFLGRSFTTQQLSGYSMCTRLMQYPIRLIAAPISNVYFQTATEYHRRGENLAEFTYSMISKILLISFLPIVMFIFSSEWLCVFVLGDTWRDVGQLASFLIIQYVLLFCSQTTSYCRVAIGRQRANLLLTSMRLAIAVISCTLGYVISGNAVGTIFIYSVGQCVYNIGDMAANFYCMDKKYLGKYLSISILYVVAMFAVLFFKSSVLGIN